MPRRASLTLNVLADLARQMRYAPRDVILGAIERCESLAEQIDPGGEYPAEWIVFRVTRYRSDEAASASDVVHGRTILAQLSAFAEHLCDAANLRESDLPEGFVEADDLARDWGVSRRTIDRCRREGLIARRVRIDGGRSRVFILARGAEAFRATNRERLGRAREYSRIDPGARDRIARLAGRYRRRHGCSLNQAAARIAQRLGRSLESIRQVLIRDEQRRAPTRQAADNRPTSTWSSRVSLTPRQRRVAYRAWRRGLEPGLVARRMGHDRQAIVRAVLLERLAALKSTGISLSGPLSPTFNRPDAARSLLGPPPVREGLGRPGETRLGRFLESARVRTVPVKAEEMARGVAYRFLLWRAAGTLAGINHLHPSAIGLDAAETDLRWASRLKAELVRSQVPLMLQIIEGRLGFGFGGRRPTEIASLLADLIRSVSDVVESFDPFRASASGATLAGSVSVAITREAARWAHRVSAPSDHGRATAVFSYDLPMEDWTRGLNPWQVLLEPDERIRQILHILPPAHSDFLTTRHGWSGAPPATLAQIRRTLGLTPMKAALLERTVLRDALSVCRSDRQR